MLSRGAYGATARGQTYVRITTPNNLELALEGLVRKVLREQPKQEDIYSFAADYFETLLDIRDKAELPNKKTEEICPNHSEFEAQSLIKLATSFPKPAFLASAIVTEEMCRVVDFDEIRAREEKTVIDLTDVTAVEGNEGSSESEQQDESDEAEPTKMDIEENEGTPENDDYNTDKLADELEAKLELDDNVNNDESQELQQDDVTDKIPEEDDTVIVNVDQTQSNDVEVVTEETHSENGQTVDPEPVSESGGAVEEPQLKNGEIVGEADSLIEVTDEQEKGDEIRNDDASEADKTIENVESIDDNQNDNPAENSVINENETDLNEDELVLPKEGDELELESPPESDKDSIPKNDINDKIAPIMLETKPLENIEDPSDILIKSESTETNDTIPAEDAERDIIKEFIDREKDFCTMGNSTRSIEVAEIHDVDVEEEVPMKEEEVIQEAMAKELLVENSELVGDVPSDSSSTKIKDGAIMTPAVGGIVGGVTYAASNSMGEKVDAGNLEEKAESLMSIANHEEKEGSDLVESTRKKRSIEDQDKSEEDNGVADGEINDEEGDSANIVVDKQDNNIDSSTSLMDEEKIIEIVEGKIVEPEMPMTTDREPFQINNEDSTPSETKGSNEDLEQKSGAEDELKDNDIITSNDDAESVTHDSVDKTDNDEKNEETVESKTENVQSTEEEEKGNETENEANEAEVSKSEEKEKSPSIEEKSENKPNNSMLEEEERDEHSIMGEEVKEDDNSKEPSLETIEEERVDPIDSKAETPEGCLDSNDKEETQISTSSDNELNKNEDNELTRNDGEDVQDGGSKEEVQNESELTVSPAVETSASEEVAISNTDDQISQEAEAVVADVIEKATENAIKMESTSAEQEEEKTENNQLEIKEIKTELESLPKQVEESAIEIISNESENSRSRSSKDSESLGDENPFISAEVKTLVETEGSAEEVEDAEDEEDKIVPLNSEINPIEEQDEGQWAAQMALVKAALTIQKTFRAFLHRKRNNSKTEDQSKEVLADSEVQEEIVKSQSSALNESMSSDSSLSSSATKIQQSEHKSLKLTRRNTAVENATTNSLTEGDVKERTKSFSISHRVRDSEVWSTLEHELESAATTIQNSYKNYKTRQRLRREDAVQITTTASEDSEGSPKREGLQGTGELHDVIVPEEFEGK